MRLKSLHILGYKSLDDFVVKFDDLGSIDILVGKNGSGKSNMFEAIAEIFRHLYEFDRDGDAPAFDYGIEYEIDGSVVSVTWRSMALTINGRARKTVGQTPLPDNVLIYYSGHNAIVPNLVRASEDSFGRRIRVAKLDESRRFIGLGPDYKALLATTLLMQPESNTARQYICEKLGISKASSELRLTFKRPGYASDPRYDIVDRIADRYWKAEGITKEFLDRLSECLVSDEGAPVREEGYFDSSDRYIQYIYVPKLQAEFAELTAQELFRQFDNLKTLGMLAEMSMPVTLSNGTSTSTDNFSDGEFQSVSIYSMVELFKDRNCVTLLDEPDSFLHPEWQHDFLRLVQQIGGETDRRNHLLISTHSPVTLLAHAKSKVKYFESQAGATRTFDLPKPKAIQRLSADLIRYSEQAQLLSIINVIQIENKPVLFTEGSTDPVILKTAWYKLYDEEIPFIPFYAFSCTYIKQLLTDQRIHHEMGGLPVFGLFDFDKAFDQWNGLNGTVLQPDPALGMIKQWANGDSYAIMIPVPDQALVKKQVYLDGESGETYGGNSYCEIELLLYGDPATGAYFEEVPWVGGGNKLVFKADSAKTSFAKEVVPLVDSAQFEVFRPLFEFVRSKCVMPVTESTTNS